YRVTIELPVLDGLGSVDVALEREGVRVACEIAVTTTPEHEADNIQKCLAAGFDHVAVVSPDRKTLGRIRDVAGVVLQEADSARVQHCTPEELFAFLETVSAQNAGRGVKSRGYTVKVRYKSAGKTEEKAKKQAVGQVIIGALRRLGAKPPA